MRLMFISEKVPETLHLAFRIRAKNNIQDYAGQMTS